MTLADLAARLGCRLEGDGAIEIARVATLDQAGPGDLTFLANPSYAQAAQRTRASAIILADDAPAGALRDVAIGASLSIVCRRAWRCSAATSGLADGVHPTAVVAPRCADRRTACPSAPFVVVGAGADIGDRVVLHPHVVLGPGVRIGEDSVLHARVSVRERSVLGRRVVVQDGAVIGSDGYGYVTDPDGVHHKIPQHSVVVIDDDVEIGANTTIDRPAVGETRIGRGTKIDNLVQIAHGVKVGEHALLVAQVGIAGSSTIGDHVRAGRAGGCGRAHHRSATARAPRPRPASPTRSSRARRSRAIRPSTTASGSRRRRYSGICQNSAGR